MPSKAAELSSRLRDLPSVDTLLRSDAGRAIAAADGEPYATDLIRLVLDELRENILDSLVEQGTVLLQTALERLEEAWAAERREGVQRVINATGVVIHTNLGRAPLSHAAQNALLGQGSGYCTLEYDLATGKRGRRGRRAEALIAELTGAEDAIVVNNCAAAAFFVLTAYAAGGEVVISRGELVEIGGDFRVPDVLAQSGAALREVGTTNRTKLSDYEGAIGERTRMLLRVHPSNYRIVGFTAAPALSELAQLAHRNDLLLYEDIGSGALIDLAQRGVRDEPVVAASLAAGVDVVTFSGDKLLGGPQAGMIAGSSKVIGRLRRHPLYRALRVDKLIYAALEATLLAYRRGTPDEVPVLRMLSMTKQEIADRVEAFMKRLAENRGDDNLHLEMRDDFSAIGGGAAPAARLETALLALSHKKMSASRLEKKLRDADPPVIARIVDDRVVLDLRTVAESEEEELLTALQEL